MKAGDTLLIAMVVIALGLIPADLLYTSRFVSRFKEIEKEKIITSNQLATAKIVSENLNHVRDLVFRNMDFSGQRDSLPEETIIFDFLTSCVNDLKMKLVSVRPSRPKVKGRITTFGYDIQLEGDFFSFGELCSKFENSQRILALSSFEVSNAVQSDENEFIAKSGKQVSKPLIVERRSIQITLHLESFRVKKGF